jgi:uncharacterized protein (DUF2249 family)
MDLTTETRLAKTLDEIPGALEYVVGLNPHDFGRLQNSTLRKYMAPRITLGRVAAMAGIPAEKLLGDLATISGGLATAVAPTGAGERPSSPSSPPAWLAEAEAAGLHDVDVLPIDEVLGDPLPPINTAIKRLEPGAILVIHHRWEPQPLYDVWTKMGLEWFARRVSAEEWQIFVRRPPGVVATGAPTTPTVDLRHLPPTERAPRLIAMFEQLRAGEALDAWAEAADWLDDVRASLERQHGGEYTWSQRDGPDRLNVRIVRSGRPAARS